MFFKNKAKKISAVAFVFLALFFFAGTASAGSTDNAVGWLWGGSQDGSNNTYAGVGWISLNSTNTSSPINYGVKFPLDGLSSASGYAWSENLGWISFNDGTVAPYPNDLAGCPTVPCSARIEGESIKGWARVLSIKDAGSNSGGWSGFINLDRVTFNSSSGRLGGYAWNGENVNDPLLGSGNIANGLGWINFSRAGIAISDPPRIFSICRENCNSENDLSKTGYITPLFYIGATKNLKACYNSFGCLSLDPLADVTSSSVWTEGSLVPGSAISLSGGNPNVATAMNDGNETIKATYQGNEAPATFQVSSIPPKTCWRCDSVSHNCSSGTVYAVNCPEESPINSESECNTICKYGSWKEVAP